MKRKKFERQQKEREQNHARKREISFNSLPEVLINPSKMYAGEYWWNCPNHDGSFTYSKEINAKWGHPENAVFCAVCCNYFRFKVKEGESA